jgi:hypothetical protein
LVQGVAQVKRVIFKVRLSIVKGPWFSFDGVSKGTLSNLLIEGILYLYYFETLFSFNNHGSHWD